MNFLLDTDTCSEQLRGNWHVYSKAAMHRGQLAISAITLGELYVWGLRKKRLTTAVARNCGVRDGNAGAACTPGFSTWGNHDRFRYADRFDGDRTQLDFGDSQHQ